MTRERMRAQAIKAMVSGYANRLADGDAKFADLMAAALDALGNAGFHVTETRVTAQQKEAAKAVGIFSDADWERCFRAMAAAGDLTKERP